MPSTRIEGLLRDYRDAVRRERAPALAAKAREYRKAHPDRVAETVRKYREANPEVVRAFSAARRARKQAATVGCPVALRDFERTRWAAEGFAGCEMHLDHIVPLARGGAHSVENLRWLPARLNAAKSDKLDHEVTDPEFRAWVDGSPSYESNAPI